MGFIEWFKSTTFEGKIKRDLGSLNLHRYGVKTRIKVQELAESDRRPGRRFRLGFVTTTFASWHSQPLVLSEDQLRQLTTLLQQALDGAPDSPSIQPRAW